MTTMILSIPTPRRKPADPPPSTSPLSPQTASLYIRAAAAQWLRELKASSPWATFAASVRSPSLPPAPPAAGNATPPPLVRIVGGNSRASSGDSTPAATPPSQLPLLPPCPVPTNAGARDRVTGILHDLLSVPEAASVAGELGEYARLHTLVQSLLPWLSNQEAFSNCLSTHLPKLASDEGSEGDDAPLPIPSPSAATPLYKSPPSALLNASEGEEEDTGSQLTSSEEDTATSSSTVLPSVEQPLPCGRATTATATSSSTGKHLTATRTTTVASPSLDVGAAPYIPKSSSSTSLSTSSSTASPTTASTSTTRSSPPVTYHLESREAMIRRRQAAPVAFYNAAQHGHPHHPHHAAPPTSPACCSTSSSGMMTPHAARSGGGAPGPQSHQTRHHNNSSSPHLLKSPPITSSSSGADHLMALNAAASSLSASSTPFFSPSTPSTTPSVMMGHYTPKSAALNSPAATLMQVPLYALHQSTAAPLGSVGSSAAGGGMVDNSVGCRYDYVMVLDFEATCEECPPMDYLHEIIEFPVVLIDLHLNRPVAEFHSFVKPSRKPILSDFCRELTGISQSSINAAPPLEEVIRQFERWVFHTIPPHSHTVFATDGSSDMQTFMYLHSVCRLGVSFPLSFYRWIDVKKVFAAFFQCPPGKIRGMLDVLQRPLIGRLHSGMDDARNVASIVIGLVQWGSTLEESPICSVQYHSSPPPLSLGPSVWFSERDVMAE